MVPAPRVPMCRHHKLNSHKAAQQPKNACPVNPQHEPARVRRRGDEARLPGTGPPTPGIWGLFEVVGCRFEVRGACFRIRATGGPRGIPGCVGFRAGTSSTSGAQEESPFRIRGFEACAPRFKSQSAGSRHGDEPAQAHESPKALNRSVFSLEGPTSRSKTVRPVTRSM